MMMHVNTIVFAGQNFDPGMFDHQEVFDRRPDPGRLVIAGPVLQCSYEGGTKSFSVTPDRIDIRQDAPEVMPQALKEAVQRVADMAGRSSVTDVGFNCDTAIPRDDGDTGTTFCRSVVRMEALDRLLGTPAHSIVPFVVSHYTRGALRYIVRLESEFKSQGQNLFVAVNGSQQLNRSTSVADALLQLSAFRSYVGEIHARIG